jgi:hypothetical protein
MGWKGHLSLLGSFLISVVLEFGKMSVRMGLATFCSKLAMSAAQSVSDYPFKTGRKQTYKL